MRLEACTGGGVLRDVRSLLGTRAELSDAVRSAQRVCELLLAHLRAAPDRARLRPPIELRLGRAATPARAPTRCPAPARRDLPRVPAAHGPTAFPAAARPHMRSAFPLLLVGRPMRLLARGARAIAPVLTRAGVFRCARLLERDRNRLPPVLDLAGSPGAAALELAVLELVHHAPHGLALPGR